MASKRMFSKEIVNTDQFTNMSLAARGLYFHLAVEADDEGFLSSTLRITRSIGGSETELEELISSGYLIRFDTGIYLIRHWFCHNTIKADRFTPSIHISEKKHVQLIDKIYFLKADSDCFQNGSTSETQRSIDKNSIDKDSEGERKATSRPLSFSVPSESELTEYASRIGYENFNNAKFLAYYNAREWLDSHGTPISDWRKQVAIWKEREKDFQSNRSPFNNQFNTFMKHNDYNFEEIEKKIKAN